MAGLAFYVVVYTLILKRRTWQNIVWGGAAGAFPPLVGWTAVTHHLNAFAWLLFAIIFVWTPVHFWALAILLKEDYTKAGIPMLPSVRGERVTVRQIAYYTVATVALTLAPFGLHYAGWIYLDRGRPAKRRAGKVRGQTVRPPGASAGVASVPLLDAVPCPAVFDAWR